MNKRSCDLIYKIIMALGLEYLLFFSVESILPGLIVRVFNINIFLVGMVGFIVLLLLNKRNCLGVFLKKGGENNNDDVEKLFFWKYFLISLVFFLGVVIFIVLHKVFLLLNFAYVFGILFVAIILWLNK